jgi:magnesium chelatase family protein
MLANFYTLVTAGIDAKPVKVEVDIQSGALPGFDKVGNKSQTRYQSFLRCVRYRFNAHSRVTLAD